MSTAAIQKLVNELKTIEVECLGDTDADAKKAQMKADKQLDAFQINKRDLTALLREAKESITRRNELVRKVGPRGEEAIRLRTTNARTLEQCRRHLAKMEEAFAKDEERFNKGKKKALAEEDINTRRELIDLFSRDLAHAEAMHKADTGGGDGGGRTGHRMARNARDARKRKKDRDAGGSSGNGTISTDDVELEAQPLSRQEQMFIQEANKRDEEIDEKLDQIHLGVKQLGRMAEDIHTELRVQEGMLEQVEDKMGNVIDKYESANLRMNKLLDASGGVSRWCPVIIAGIILLALLAYIYNISQFST